MYSVTTGGMLQVKCTSLCMVGLLCQRFVEKFASQLSAHRNWERLV